MQLRYVVARLLPDLVREEPINVGVILQSDKRVDCRFIDRVPKDWGLEEDMVDDVATKLQASWETRLAKAAETLYFPNKRQRREIHHTDPRFLDWLQQTYKRHLRFTETREASVTVRDAFDFDTFLQHLFGLFVAPKPRPRKPIAHGRLHTAVKHELTNVFTHLHVPREKLREREAIVGSFPWPIDFIYSSNGKGDEKHEVGIGIVDFASVNFLEKAKDLVATWADISKVRQDPVTKLSVVGGAAMLEEHERALGMLGMFSDQVYLFDRDKRRFLDLIRSDLGASNGQGRLKEELHETYQ